MSGILVARWQRFWFEPMPAARLGIVRLLFFAGVLYLYRMELPSPARWADAPEAFWFPQNPVFRAIGPMSEATLGTIRALFLVALAGASLGVLTRLSMTATFVLGFLYSGYSQNYGAVAHADIVVVLFSFMLMFSRCGDSWSIDSLVRNVRHRRHLVDRSLDTDSEYGWPIKGLWVGMSLMMCAAGVAKLRASGPAWVTSDTLPIWLTDSNAWYFWRSYPSTHLGDRIAEWPVVSHTMAAGSMLLELLFPVVLFFPRTRWLFVPGVILFNVLIYLLMTPYFPQMIWANMIIWLPWQRLAALLMLRVNRVDAASRQVVAVDAA